MHLLLSLATLCFVLQDCSARRCTDGDSQCPEFARNGECRPGSAVYANCFLSCNRCQRVSAMNLAYDLRRLRVDLVPVKWMPGRWLLIQVNGPFSLGPFVMPKMFDISVSPIPEFGSQNLNVTGITHGKNGSVYRSWGYVTVKNATNKVAFVMADSQVSKKFHAVPEQYDAVNYGPQWPKDRCLIQEGCFLNTQPQRQHGTKDYIRDFTWTYMEVVTFMSALFSVITAMLLE